MIQTIKGSIRKLQVTSKQAWGQVLQTAAGAYRMVPQEATGMSPFLMLYGREALLPEEIEHISYGFNVDYEKAVAGHIRKMLGIQEQALEKNAASIEKSWKYFDWKYIKKTVIYSFVVGNVVLMYVK